MCVNYGEIVSGTCCARNLRHDSRVQGDTMVQIVGIPALPILLLSPPASIACAPSKGKCRMSFAVVAEAGNTANGPGCMRVR